jgi:hypothetical protein
MTLRMTSCALGLIALGQGSALAQQFSLEGDPWLVPPPAGGGGGVGASGGAVDPPPVPVAAKNTGGGGGGGNGFGNVGKTPPPPPPPPPPAPTVPTVLGATTTGTGNVSIAGLPAVSSAKAKTITCIDIGLGDSPPGCDDKQDQKA